MTADELEHILKVLAKRRPFVAYFLELVSGDRIHVSHPEAINRSGKYFQHGAPDRCQRIFDAPSVSQVIIPSPAK